MDSTGENIARYRKLASEIDKRCRAITDYEIAGRGRDQVQVRIEVTDRGSIRHAGFIFVRPATNRYSAEHAKEL